MDTLEHALSEAELQQSVVQMAHLYGWLVHHGRPARTANGWCTPITGDVGFPDLVLVREGIIIFCELKSAEGRISTQQKKWLEQLSNNHSVRAVVWRPRDWFSGEITEILSGSHPSGGARQRIYSREYT